MIFGAIRSEGKSSLLTVGDRSHLGEPSVLSYSKHGGRSASQAVPICNLNIFGTWIHAHGLRVALWMVGHLYRLGLEVYPKQWHVWVVDVAHPLGVYNQGVVQPGPRDPMQ